MGSGAAGALKEEAGMRRLKTPKQDTGGSREDPSVGKGSQAGTTLCGFKPRKRPCGQAQKAQGQIPFGIKGRRKP